MGLNILALGDVCGAPGLALLQKRLWRLRGEYKADLVVVNGENANVRGITPDQARSLRDCGADVVTLGNHSFDRREIASYLDEDRSIIRPANYASFLPGTGVCWYDTGKAEVCVINLLGRIGVNVSPPPADPFEMAERLVAEAAKRTRFIVVDFHTETTSEKTAMAYALDGRASVLFGTHTHVQTADERIFPKGLGYITDLGMCGALDSVIGVRPDTSLAFFRGNTLSRFEDARGSAFATGALFTLGDDGKCTHVERVRVEEA